MLEILERARAHHITRVGNSLESSLGGNFDLLSVDPTTQTMYITSAEAHGRYENQPSILLIGWVSRNWNLARTNKRLPPEIQDPSHNI
jgi:hypothetical protein